MIRKKPGSIDIRPRRREYNFDTLPRVWFHDSAFMTHFLTALSVLFPEGETFFVEAARNYRERVTDEQQRRDLGYFCGQESHHTHDHVKLNDRIELLGYPVSALNGTVAVLLGLARKMLTRRQQLAVTVALEHITAILADEVLRDERLQAALHDRVRDLWVNHAAEECEHKGVCYDLYLDVGGNYVERSVAMIVSTAFLLAVVATFQARLGLTDGSIFRVGDTYRGLRRLFRRGGYLTRLVPNYLDFFRRGFHPWDHDNSHLIKDKV